MSWLDTVIGVGVAVLCLGVGFIAAEVRSATRLADRRSPAVPQPICGCGHHTSYHDESGCHHIYYDVYNRQQEGGCGCVKYIGPEALPEYLP